MDGPIIVHQMEENQQQTESQMAAPIQF